MKRTKLTLVIALLMAFAAITFVNAESDEADARVAGATDIDLTQISYKTVTAQQLGWTKVGTGEMPETWTPMQKVLFKDGDANGALYLEYKNKDSVLLEAIGNLIREKKKAYEKRKFFGMYSYLFYCAAINGHDKSFPWIILKEE